MKRVLKFVILTGLTFACFTQGALAFAPAFTYEQDLDSDLFACYATYPSGFKEIVHLDNCRVTVYRITYEQSDRDVPACIAIYTSGFSEVIDLENCRSVLIASGGFSVSN